MCGRQVEVWLVVASQVGAYFFIISIEMVYGKHIVGPQLGFKVSAGDDDDDDDDDDDVDDDDDDDGDDDDDVV
eukprot:6212646-Pleurochrysis_carterae.AAC.1